MGKWKAIMPFGLALVIAASGSVFLFKWLKSQASAKEIVRVETEAVPVAVTRMDMIWGTKLTPEMIRTVPFLKESLPPGYFSDAESVEGRVVIVALKENMPIVESALAPTSVTVGGVAAIISPGKRAIAVKGDKVIGISGFIRPGDHVDVLVTLRDPRTKSEVTKVVLQNIVVLATGTEMKENGKGGPAPVDVYTLELSPEEGEKLSLAASEGTLQFALRNATDTDTVLTKGATITEALRSFRGVDPKAAKGKPRKRKRHVTIEVIQGGNMGQQRFKYQ
jgi:pilus assembly protein CpaB